MYLIFIFRSLIVKIPNLIPNYCLSFFVENFVKNLIIFGFNSLSQYFCSSSVHVLPTFILFTYVRSYDSQSRLNPWNFFRWPLLLYYR
eukprot:UN18338